MAIGDGSADIPALKMAGFSYAMADSDRRLMDITRFYTSRAEQGGVSEAIYDYLYRLIKVKPERWI